MKKIDTAEKAKEISEDISKAKKAELQKEIDATMVVLEDMLEKKNADIMKV